MKILGCFILVAFPPTVFANSADTLQCSHGVFIDVDKYFVRDIGYKYRLSSSWALCAKVQWSIESDSPSNRQFFTDQSHSSIKLTAGAEFTMLHIGPVSLVGLGLWGYGYDTSPSDVISALAGVRQSTYSLEFGIAAEYAFSRQFSVSISQRMGVALSHFRYLSPDIPRSHTFAYLGDPVGSLIFSF